MMLVVDSFFQRFVDILRDVFNKVVSLLGFSVGYVEHLVENSAVFSFVKGVKSNASKFLVGSC